MRQLWRQNYSTISTKVPRVDKVDKIIYGLISRVDKVEKEIYIGDWLPDHNLIYIYTTLSTRSRFKC